MEIDLVFASFIVVLSTVCRSDAEKLITQADKQNQALFHK